MIPSITLSRLSIHPGFLLTVAAFFLAESSIYSFAILFCAAFHEFGHIAAIYAAGASVERFFLLPFGAEIRLSKDVGYKKELLISLSGPFAGIFLSMALFLLSELFPSEIVYFSAVCSLWLSILNLVPVRSFDGGRALRSLFFCLFPYEKALRLIRTSELLSLILLSALSAASVIFSSYNLSLCAICVLLFVSVYKTDQ